MNGFAARLKGGIDVFPATADANARRLVLARGLRALADGYVSILLPAYLLALGLDSFEVGVLATATLLGSASLTLFVGFITSRFGHRRPLLAAAGLMIATGCAFAGVQGFWPLLVVAVIGTLNPSSGDVSVFLPLEHSLLAQSVGDRDRTALYVRYSLAGSLMGAAGTLFAALPALAAEWCDASPIRIMQGLFLLYAVIGLASGLIYRRIEEPRVPHDARPRAPLGPSRRIVYRLAALFCVDSFGGGLLVQSMLALWLFQTFGLSVAAAANLFFWTSLASAVSMFAAVPLANRIGLVRTMVFTHLPSSLCLIAIPFVPSLSVVVGLLVLRSLLSQMDVPTRNSYVMAVVTPAERAAAASVTSVPRSLASALGPVISGYLFLLSGFAWPILIGGILKTSYDLALLAMFSHVRPPEEQKPASPASAPRGRPRGVA